jgi:hypothetical protein
MSVPGAPSWPQTVVLARRPVAATVLLAVGGAVALYFAGFVALASLAQFTGCLGTGSCHGPVVGFLVLYWGLLALGIATAVSAIVAAALLYGGSRHRRPIGATVVGLSMASIVALAFVFRTGLWWVVLIFGGWSLFSILLGGVLALLGTAS